MAEQSSPTTANDMAAQHFPQFARLPAELQLKIWAAAYPRVPSMHVFDVCFPSSRGSARSRRAFTRGSEASQLSDDDQKRWDTYASKVFLDALETSDSTVTPNRSSGNAALIPQHRHDPSQYLARNTLRATCLDASQVADLEGSANQGVEEENINTVYLPGSNRMVKYDNTTDVLHLRLRADNAVAPLFNQDIFLKGPDPIIPGFNDAPLDEKSGLDSQIQVLSLGDTLDLPNSADFETRSSSPATTMLATKWLASTGDAEEDEANELSYLSGFGAMLDGVWSKEMADTLYKARHIAIDISETWTDASADALVVEEVGFLACTMQHDIEVLYLVDYCVGRCTSPACARVGGKARLRARDLQRRDGVLIRDLHVDNEEEKIREPDVIVGVGKVYREVFDLEGLGWDGYHPTYAFAKIIDDAIRSQQDDGLGEVKFKGVRILVAEDEPVDGVDVGMVVDCGCKVAEEKALCRMDGEMPICSAVPGLVLA
jgi:hypothetical protein